MSHVLLIFTLFVLSVESVERKLEAMDDPSHRVIDGIPQKPGEIPFQVSIQKYGRPFCGGSIIKVGGNMAVISAAHCFYRNTNPANIRVVAGEVDLSMNTSARQTRGVSEVLIHGKFMGSVDDGSDIALLFLSKPFEITETVKPVQLPNPYQTVKNGTDFTVSGWGRQFTNSTDSSSVLLAAPLNVLDRHTCQQIWDTNQEVTWKIRDDHLCTISKSGTQSGCHGDSGGPGTVLNHYGRPILVGIVSGGSPRCDPRMPNVFTKVSKFVIWIKANILSRYGQNY